MGASGPAALVKNFRVFSIALFACIGGLLYVRNSMHVFVKGSNRVANLFYNVYNVGLQSGCLLWCSHYELFHVSHTKLQ